MTKSYSLFIAQPTSYVIADVAKAIGVVKKVPFAEATSLAKHSWGILEDKLELENAQSLAAQYLQAGLVLKVVLTENHSMSEAELIPTLNPKDVDWEKLLLIAAISFDQTSQVMTRKETGGQTPGQFIASAGLMLATGLPIRIGEKKRVVEQKKDVHEQAFLLDLFFTNPVKRWRIQYNQFDYGFLGSLKEVSSMLNFRRLLTEVIRWAPKAHLNKGATIFSQNQPLSLMGYNSLNDFERECRWLWTILQP